MNTSGPPRKTIARKPSHFGSYSRPPPAGSSSASLASIGSIGGVIANGDVGMDVAWKSSRALILPDEAAQVPQDFSPRVAGRLRPCRAEDKRIRSEASA